MVSLERHRFLAVHFRFLAFEDGAQAEQFGKDAAYGPEVDGRGVVPAAEQEFGRAVPDRNDDFVAGEERRERFMEQARETEIPDFYLSGGRHHYVCGFEIAVQHPVAVQVEQAVQQLVEDGANGAGGDAVTRGLRVVVDDLQQVVLGVFEDHEDAFFFEQDFVKADQVGVREFGAEGHFADRGLRDTGVLEEFAFFVGFESVVFGSVDYGLIREGNGAGVEREKEITRTF